MPSGPEILRTTWKALPAILLPVLILGGMRAGWFTPTEASVVAVFYALVCGKYVYRTLEWKAVPDILSRSALLTASVLLIIGMSASFAWILTIEGVPQTMANWITSIHLNAWTFLIVINVFLLLFGIFIEPLPGVMVLVPILAPVAAKIGVDPIHFAMVVIFNLTLGMITPPVGGLLFVTSNVSKVPLTELTRELKPFLIAHGVVLVVLTFVPALSNWLPHVMGLNNRVYNSPSQESALSSRQRRRRRKQQLNAQVKRTDNRPGFAPGATSLERDGGSSDTPSTEGATRSVTAPPSCPANLSGKADSEGKP
jgi:tripartite ATP-independent transporter DctM subunit